MSVDRLEQFLDGGYCSSLEYGESYNHQGNNSEKGQQHRPQVRKKACQQI